MEKKYVEIEAVVVSECHGSRGVVGIRGRFLTLLMIPTRVMVLVPEGKIGRSSRALQHYW